MTKQQQSETLRDESIEAVARNADTAAIEDATFMAYDIERTRLGGTPDIDLGELIGRLAAVFYSQGAPSDDEGSFYNDLGFQQKGMLGNLCNNADWMLGNAEKHLVDLYTKLDQQEAQLRSDNDEIGIRNLNITLDQIERCRSYQIPACREWLRVSKIAYATITGETWKPFTKKGPSRADQTADALRARIEAARNVA